MLGYLVNLLSVKNKDLRKLVYKALQALVLQVGTANTHLAEVFIFEKYNFFRKNTPAHYVTLLTLLSKMKTLTLL